MNKNEKIELDKLRKEELQLRTRYFSLVNELKYSNFVFEKEPKTSSKTIKKAPLIPLLIDRYDELIKQVSLEYETKLKGITNDVEHEQVLRDSAEIISRIKNGYALSNLSTKKSSASLE